MKCRAIQTTCSTTPNTTGRASTPRTPTSPCSGSRGSRRTRSARSCSSIRPQPGTIIHKDEPYAEVESVKAVSDVVAPLSGEIVEVNEKLADSPNAINDDPYGEGWLVKVRMSDPSEREALLDADAYSATLGA